MSGGQYRPLAEADIRRIHEASLQVLETVGVGIRPSECRDVFQAAGARIDPEQGRVLIPRAMAEDAIAAAPNEVVLCGRDPRHDMVLGGTRVYMGTGGAAIHVMDLDSGEIRASTLKDVARIAKLVDALEHIHFYLRACVATDIPLSHLDVNTYYAALANTTKHVTGNCFSVQSVEQVTEMAGMIVGGRRRLRDRPVFSVTSCFAVSPLRYAPDTVEVLTEVVRRGVPVFLSSAPQAGGTSPAAAAGTLVQLNAEELSGLVYTQLVRRRAPVVLGYVPLVMDLRTGEFTGGAPEYGLMQAAACQLGHFYNLPVYCSSGLTDAKVSDSQAGYEKAISGMAAALAGGNFIHHSAGFLEAMNTVAYGQYVVDNDINGAVLRLVRGIDVTDESLSVEVIAQVCRGEKGHYLGTRQSMKLAETDYVYPRVSDRRSRSQWERGGSSTIWDRACSTARGILAEHQPEPIPREIDGAIRERFDILLPSKGF